ncbi:outer membrane beta-barrel protein [Leptospira jelokensis]|uniref:Porin n=1 Tax=Leptospira jelokensis TaxID=2484931 RepID=A0A4Z1AA88_9LEPT|nr:outer membrane beta-barrel protein [Leptospira jelokensis]TGL72869.1 porin [Leptospira jelokensis]
MRNKYTLLATSVALLVSSSVFAQGEAKEKSWYDKINVSGYVDVFYMYTANNVEGAKRDSSGTFNTQNKQFGVSSAVLDLQKLADKDSPWGFRTVFQNGQNNVYQEAPYNQTNSTVNMNMLQQAYVSFYFPVLKGLTVDMGKMATHIGYELLDTKDNPTYTIGYIFFNTIPFINTGARANLAVSDKLNLGFYLYNSVGGTGSDISAYNNANISTYRDGVNKNKAVGTQVSYDIISDKLKVAWNTLYGVDVTYARPSNGDYWMNEVYGTPINARRASYQNDYWLINNVILSFTPNDKTLLVFDYTQGDKSGAAATLNDPTTQVDLDGTGTTKVSLTRDDSNAKRVYKTYGLWGRYKFSDKWALAGRYERIDDSRNGAPLGVSNNTAGRYDLQYMSGLGYNSTKYYLGSAQTFTITPTYYYGDNIIIKVDFRRDQAKGQVFTDEKGQPQSHQNGVTLGIVATF